MRRTPTLLILAWALYDFAITIFSMNVISRYFGLWVTETMGGSDWQYSVAFAISMGGAALAMPFIGSWADRTGQFSWCLRLASLTGVLCTLWLGITRQLGVGLCLFGLANAGVQIGGFLYDALLPTMSQGRRAGAVSGLGVACGYAGSLTGLVVVAPFVTRGGHQAAFIPSALLVALAAAPCLLLVKPPARPKAARARRPSLHEMIHAAKSTPGWTRFLLAIFLCINAINTVIMFMAIYARRVWDLSDPELNRLLMLSTASALCGALGAGWLANRWGPWRSLNAVFGMWCAALALATVVSQRALVWWLGPAVGVALGATWTAARALVAAMAPQDRAGEFFGLYGMVGRASSNFGPLIWGQLIATWPGHSGLRDRMAMASLGALMLAGWLIFRGMPVSARAAAAARTDG
ncbi:MAG: MFS transporter [Candidatus Omnitrophica bacterium]|nr:MFS transporter [Candidatus Omnitrophota bacterium]